MTHKRIICEYSLIYFLFRLQLAVIEGNYEKRKGLRTALVCKSTTRHTQFKHYAEICRLYGVNESKG